MVEDSQWLEEEENWREVDPQHLDQDTRTNPLQHHHTQNLHLPWEWVRPW